MNAGDYSQTNTCGASLPAAGSCSVSVTFTPALAGARTASLTLADDASNTPQSITLTGNGIPPAVSLHPSLLVFPINSSEQRALPSS